MRLLRAIYNLNPENSDFKDPHFATISKIELMEGLNQSQTNLLFRHDIEYD